MTMGPETEAFADVTAAWQHDCSLVRARPARAAVAVSALSVLTTALLTVVVVLWFPISMAALERADDAGWDERLLLPHQFLLDLAVGGAWLVSAAATVVSLVCLCRSRRACAAAAGGRW